jgi:hypothetical protein
MSIFNVDVHTPSCEIQRVETKYLRSVFSVAVRGVVILYLSEQVIRILVEYREYFDTGELKYGSIVALGFCFFILPPYSGARSHIGAQG